MVLLKRAYRMDRTELAKYTDLEQGLSAKEAARRLKKDGPNALPEEKPPTLLRRLTEQLGDPMVLILLAAATVSALLGEWTDSGVIACVVAVNAFLGLYQEGRAAKAVAALARLHSPTALVKRGGRLLRIPSRELVCGDMVLLEAGDAAPADIRLVTAVHLQTDESSLSGESRPVAKSAAVLPDKQRELPAEEQVNMVFMGSPVLTGRGEGVVAAVGGDTALGRIAGLLGHTETQRTPLQRRLAQLCRILTAAVCAVCAAVFLLSLGSGGTAQLLDSFLLAVSLAVAAIPEGLVVVVTLVLSLGMKAMSRRNAIIRRLAAVETLGSVQVICSDKTGTLTQNRMAVRETRGDDRLLARALCLCSDAVIEGKTETGDPMELAFLRFGQELGLDAAALRAAAPRYDEIPFDSESKLMTTFHHEKEGDCRYIKGAPEKVLALCGSYLNEKGQVRPFSAAARQRMAAEHEALAEKGMRVLAAAFAPEESCAARLSLPSPATAAAKDSSGGTQRKPRTKQPAPGMNTAAPAATAADSARFSAPVYIGCVGLLDPPRPSAKKSIRAAKAAGIKVVMVSGDHPRTAAAIAKELGIYREGDLIVSGGELRELSDGELRRLLPRVSVFARVQPEDKLRIVRGWQALGRVTAMTGDGVNDAPALKAADIGCAMGKSGSEVSRRAAHLVLADDDFATIVCAVKEGRRIYTNIRKAVAFLLSSNLAEVCAIFAASLLGIRLFYPVHLLWINLLTDCFPAVALGLEQADRGLMSRPPVPPERSLFAGGVGAGILRQGAAAALLTLISFALGAPEGERTAMTMAFLTLNAAELAQAVNMRELRQSSLRTGRRNPLLAVSLLAALLLDLALLYLPPLTALFRLTALPPHRLLLGLGLGLAMIPLVELGKLLRRLLRRH